MTGKTWSTYTDRPGGKRGREDGGKFLDPFTSQISRRDRKLSERGRDKIKFFLSCNIEDLVAVGHVCV